MGKYRRRLSNPGGTRWRFNSNSCLRLQSGRLWKKGILGRALAKTPTKARGGIDVAPNQRKRYESMAFVFLTVVLAPVLAVAAVGGYGFLIWIFQIIFGPPTS